MCGKRKGCVFVLLVVVVVAQVGLVLGGVPDPTGLEGLAQEPVGLVFSSSAGAHLFVLAPSYILSYYHVFPAIRFFCVRHMNPVFVGYYLSFIDVPLSCEQEPTFMLIQQLSV